MTAAGILSDGIVNVVVVVGNVVVGNVYDGGGNEEVRRRRQRVGKGERRKGERGAYATLTLCLQGYGAYETT